MTAVLMGMGHIYHGCSFAHSAPGAPRRTSGDPVQHDVADTRVVGRGLDDLDTAFESRLGPGEAGRFVGEQGEQGLTCVYLRTWFGVQQHACAGLDRILLARPTRPQP